MRERIFVLDINYKKMTSAVFEKYINKLCENLSGFIQKNRIKVDYICPVLRSGAIPAVYISNRLNIVKFLPFQVKHIAYKNGENKIDMIFNPLNLIDLKKDTPVFLVVEAMHSTGSSVESCINAIKEKFNNAKILYVCLAKEYGSKDFLDLTIYEDFAFYYNGNNGFSEDKCKDLDIEYYHPLFPWEVLDFELNHPDDLEENIFF